MAECQVSYDYPEGDQEKIKLNLSPRRFAPYLKKAGFNNTYAFNLYLFNARLSKAFLFPLHVLEISLRNRISEIFTSMYGQDWTLNQSFLQELTVESRSTLNTAKERASSEDTDDIVSTMTFDFWSNLFRPKYDRCFWQAHMQTLLPNNVMSRHDFQKSIKEINKFRNRIAHHEPIHQLNISAKHTLILNVLKWISDETYKWTKHHSTFSSILRTSPSANGEPKPHFKERCDNNFTLLNENTTLEKLTQTHQKLILCQDRKHKLLSVIDNNHIAKFFLAMIDDDNKTLMLDLSDYNFNDLIEKVDCKNNFTVSAANESLIKARLLFKKKDVEYIVTHEDDKVIGVIAKSHRQY